MAERDYDEAQVKAARPVEPSLREKAMDAGEPSVTSQRPEDEIDDAGRLCL